MLVESEMIMDVHFLVGTSIYVESLESEQYGKLTLENDTFNVSGGLLTPTDITFTASDVVFIRKCNDTYIVWLNR